jgi:uncharacterized membrane protein
MSQPPEYRGNPGDPRSGGYQQVPPGGYGAPPPQPPPGYGTPPPAPGYGQPAGGYGQPGQPGYGQPAYGQPAGGQPFSAGDAFNWAWNSFSKNAAALIVPMIIYGVGLVVLWIVLQLILGAIGLAAIGGSAATSTDRYGQTSSAGAGLGFFGWMIGMALMSFVFVLAVSYVQAAFVSGALEIADGRPVSISSFLRPPRNFGQVIVAALLVGLGVAVGYMLCFLPGLIFAFFSFFTIPFVVDRGLSPIDAMKASFSTINRNLGSAILAYLIIVAVGIVGGAVLCVGTFISVPVSLLILTYTYRRLSGGQIVPALVSPPQPYQQPYPQQQPYQQQPYPQQQPYQQQPYPQQQPYQPPQPPYQQPPPYQG